MNAASPTKAELREALMRCGAWAISERIDGCLSKTQAMKIREIAYRMCWPEDAAGEPRADKRPASSDGMGEPASAGTACRDTLKSEQTFSAGEPQP